MSTKAEKLFDDSFDPELNITMKWQDWVDDLSDERLIDLIHEYDDPINTGELTANEAYQGQMVVDMMMLAIDGTDFIRMYTTVFYGFVIQAAINNDSDQSTITEIISNSKYLATILWNVSHGLAKNLLNDSLPSVATAISEELGEDGQKILDNIKWDELDTNIVEVELV